MRVVICLLAILLLTLHSESQSSELAVDSAIVLVVDMSSSMKDDERYLARESHASAIESYEVVYAIKQGYYQRSVFAYVEFSGKPLVQISWTIIDSQGSASSFAASIRSLPRLNSAGSTTAIGEALQLAVDLFAMLPYKPLYKTVDVAGDGTSNDGVSVAGPRQTLLDDHITINGLPMMLNSDYSNLDEYYASQIIGGPRAFSIPLNDIQEMPLLVRRKLVQELG